MDLEKTATRPDHQDQEAEQELAQTELRDANGVVSVRVLNTR